MGVEPNAVRCLVGRECRRHPAHAAAFAHEVDRQPAAGTELLCRGTDVPVELPCELSLAHVLPPTVLRRRIDAQRAERLDVAAQNDFGGVGGSSPMSRPARKGLADPASI